MISRYKITKHDDERNALLSVFESGAWVNGSHINEVSGQLKKIFSKQYCTLTGNGYSALFLALKSLDLKNEKIIVPAASTCFAIVNAVLASGNQPVFADLNLTDATINLNSAKKLQQQHNAKCIITVNLFGNLSNCAELKKELNITVIEDCAQSFISNTQFVSEADIQVFSFYPSKIMNGIDGGAILTNNEKVCSYVNDAVYYDEQLKYDGKERYNMRMPNIHAAVLLSNINKLAWYKEEYMAIQAEFEKNSASNKKYKIVKKNNSILSRFVLLFNTLSDKQEFVTACTQKNIQTSDVLMNVGNTEIDYETKSLIQNTISIPYYLNLMEVDKEKIFQVLSKN